MIRCCKKYGGINKVKKEKNYNEKSNFTIYICTILNVIILCICFGCLCAFYKSINVMRGDVMVYDADGVRIDGSPLYTKKLCAIGDSYVQALSGNTKNWVSLISDKNNMTSTNLGVSGESVQTMVSTERYKNIPADSDYIVVFTGHNDIYTEETPIGTINDLSDDTYFGCLNILCRWIMNNRPQARTLFITPTHRRDVNSIPYVDAMLQTCHKYGIPCWNAYENLGILIGGLEGVDQRSTFETYINGQYTNHLNDKGQEYIAQKIEAILELL